MNAVRENLIAFVQGRQMPYGKGPQNELVLYPGVVPEHRDAVEGLLEMICIHNVESTLEEIWKPANSNKESL